MHCFVEFIIIVSVAELVAETRRVPIAAVIVVQSAPSRLADHVHTAAATAEASVEADRHGAGAVLARHDAQLGASARPVAHAGRQPQSPVEQIAYAACSCASSSRPGNHGEDGQRPRPGETHGHG